MGVSGMAPEHGALAALGAPPGFVPAGQFDIIEPESRVHAVRPDRVLGRGKTACSALHLVTKEILGDALVGGADQVIDAGTTVTEVFGRVVHEVGQFKAVDSGETKKIFGVKVAAR